MKMTHTTKIIQFCCLFVIALWCRGSRASDNFGDSSHEAQYPTPAVVLQQTRASSASSTNPESPKYKTQISFLNHEENEKVTWGPSGRYEADITIDRYFGTEPERQTMIARGSMMESAILYIPCYDCDSSPSDGTTSGDAPQVDLVYLNGHYLGKLSGVNNTATMNIFEVPVKYLNFPEHPGERAKNHLKILVDTANDHLVWYLGQLWQMLVIEAPLPVLLVHGWTREQDAMEEFSRHLSEILGIPSVFVDVSADDSPYTNAVQLQMDLSRLTGLWGVEQFNIVAHSKGGLDSRVLVDQNGLQSQQVFKVMQVATPNRGSLFADVALAPVGRKQRLYSLAAEIFQDATQASQSFTSLTVENCIRFNEMYSSPICPLHTITGRVDFEDLSPSYRALANFVDLGEPNDGMVAVSSAHAIQTQISASPLYAEGTSRYDHSGIIREGAPDVIQAYAEKLEEWPDTEYDLPPYLNMKFSGTTTRGGNEDTEEEPCSPNAYFETDVIALEKGKIHEVEIRILSGGDATVGVFPCAPETQAELIMPSDNGILPMAAETLPPCVAANASILTAELHDIAPGIYRLRVDCTGAENNAVAKVLVREENPVFTVKMAVEESAPPTPKARVSASCFYHGECVKGDAVGMILRATKPYETTAVPVEIVMHDDGMNGDAVPQDGVFTVEFQPSEFGQWNLEVEATGEFDGIRFSRFANASVAVTDATGSFTVPLVETTDFPVGTLQLSALTFSSEVTVNRAGRYCLTAELAAPDGTVVGHAGVQWEAVGTECQTRVLEFPTTGIVARKEDGPWTIQKLRLNLIGDGTRMGAPILLAQSDFTQQTKETKYSEIAKYDFEIRILGTGSEKILEDAAAISQELEVCMDVEVIGTPPETLLFQTQVLATIGESGGFAEGELIRGTAGYQLVAYLGADAIQSLEARNSFVLKGCRATFYDEDGLPHEMMIEGSYRTQEYPCALFQNPTKSSSYENGDCLRVDCNDTPDDNGFYKATLQYTEPEKESDDTEEEVAPSEDGSSLEVNEMFYACLPGLSVDAFHLKDGFLLVSSPLKGEYANITEEVRQQLRSIGDCDGILDPGETLEVEVSYRRGDCWGEGYDIADMLAFCVMEYEPVEESQRCDIVVHSFDTNADLVISREELDAGELSWREGGTQPQTLLEGLELHQAEQYSFDEETRQFYPQCTQ